MKFLHCSDLHLGKKPSFGSEIFKARRFEDYFNAFERIIEQAKKNNVEAIIVAGDFFDKKETNPNILINTEKLLQKCKEYKIDVIIIEGNHDLIYKDKEADSWIIYLENKELLKRPLKNKPVIIDTVKFFGLGYPGAYVDDELLEFAEYCKENNICNCVLLVHTAISNNEFIGGFLKDKTVLNKIKNYVIYIAGGHGHKLNTYPEQSPFFFVPGSPEYYDFGEDSNLKTAIIFDTDLKEHKILAQHPRNRMIESVNLDCTSQDEFKKEFNNFLSSLKITNEDIVIIKIKHLKNDFIPDIKWAESRILEKGALFAKAELERENVRFGSVSSNRRSIEEIELEQIKKWDYWSKAAETAAKALAEMRQSVANGQDDISHIFDSVLNSIVAGKK